MIVSHLSGVGIGGNITDHEATAPPLGSVGITCMDKKSIMNLEKKINLIEINLFLEHFIAAKFYHKRQINLPTSVRLSEDKAQLRPPAPAPLGSPG